MPRLTGYSSQGGVIDTLARAVNSLRDLASSQITLTTTGNLSVATGLHTAQVTGTCLDAVSFTVTTAPVGADLIFDVMASIDGVAFGSTTGGAGCHVPDGKTTAALAGFNPILEVSATGVGPYLRIDCLQVGSSTAGAGLTVVIDTGAF
jgi:hypothetical protein